MYKVIEFFGWGGGGGFPERPARNSGVILVSGVGKLEVQGRVVLFFWFRTERIISGEGGRSSIFLGPAPTPADPERNRPNGRSAPERGMRSPVMGLAVEVEGPVYINSLFLYFFKRRLGGT